MTFVFNKSVQNITNYQLHNLTTIQNCEAPTQKIVSSEVLTQLWVGDSHDPFYFYFNFLQSLTQVESTFCPAARCRFCPKYGSVQNLSLALHLAIMQ